MLIIVPSTQFRSFMDIQLILVKEGKVNEIVRRTFYDFEDLRSVTKAFDVSMTVY